MKEVLRNSLMGAVLSEMVEHLVLPFDETHDQAVGNDNFALVHGQFVVGDDGSDVGTLREVLLNFRVGDLAFRDQVVAHRHVVII